MRISTGKNSYKLITTKYHCIGCGSGELKEMEGQEDYYAGTNHLCLKCMKTFWICSEPKILDKSHIIIKDNT